MHASTTIAIDSSSKAVSIKASASIAEYAIHWTLCTAGTGGTRRWRFFIWVFDINAVVYWLFCFWNGPKTVVWHRGCCAVWNVVMSLFSARKSFAVITVPQLYEGKRFLVSFQSLPSLYFLFFPQIPGSQCSLHPAVCRTCRVQKLSCASHMRRGKKRELIIDN